MCLSINYLYTHHNSQNLKYINEVIKKLHKFLSLNFLTLFEFKYFMKSHLISIHRNFGHSPNSSKSNENIKQFFKKQKI